MASNVAARDGSLDFSGGVNSLAVTTLASETAPGGLQRNQLAWLTNGELRDGGITPRAGWLYRGVVASADGLFQGKTMYAPFGATPYEIWAVSGHILKVDCETYAVTDLSDQFNLYHPADQTYFYFCQAEEFLIIQAGDGVTLPLIWDGVTMRRSIGINNTAVAPGTPGVNEIPAATAMDYFMGRLWYAQDRTINAGDIVKGPSGTLAYAFRDSVLNVTENPMVVGGDGFTIPSQDGTVIRGIAHSANIDAALGQGRLFVGTRKAIYALNVPVTRTDWINATNNNVPLITVVQLTNGWVNDRSIVSVNGDLFYQSLEPGIRSLMQSVRNFTQWANVEISSNENRILQFNDRALLRFGSGIFFNNRLLQTALPRQLPQGVVHDSIIPLDVSPISTFNSQRPPNWEGNYEGIPILQMAVGDFGGNERAFTAVVSTVDGTMQIWEMTTNSRVENVDNRIVMVTEYPAFTWAATLRELEMKKLVSAEIWVDRLWGTVQFQLEYRPDGATCWIPWRIWKECSPRNTAESVGLPVEYPENMGECYKMTMILPMPPLECSPCGTGRPAYIGYQFQARLITKGYMRIRGFWLWAEKFERQQYGSQMVC